MTLERYYRQAAKGLPGGVLRAAFVRADPLDLSHGEAAARLRG